MRLNADIIYHNLKDTLDEGLAGLLVGLAAWQNRGLTKDIERLSPYLIDRLLHAETANMSAGLMRGKAGLAYALAKCEELSESKEQKLLCQKRREELFLMIRSEYCGSLSAWPDTEKLARPLFPALDLEKGAPGIGLSAANSSNELLSLSAESICRGSLLPADTILRGNAGSALLLIKAAETLKENKYLEPEGTGDSGFSTHT